MRRNSYFPHLAGRAEGPIDILQGSRFQGSSIGIYLTGNPSIAAPLRTQRQLRWRWRPEGGSGGSASDASASAAAALRVPLANASPPTSRRGNRSRSSSSSSGSHPRTLAIRSQSIDPPSSRCCSPESDRAPMNSERASACDALPLLAGTQGRGTSDQTRTILHSPAHGRKSPLRLDKIGR